MARRDVASANHPVDERTVNRRVTKAINDRVPVGRVVRVYLKKPDGVKFFVESPGTIKTLINEVRKFVEAGALPA